MGAQKGKETVSSENDELIAFVPGQGYGHPGEKKGAAGGEGKNGTEGDPQIKGRIRQKMREASQRRMMQDVPKADVVITNPTHFAVAIKYDAEVSKAPVVVAKGEDFLAQKIKEVAKENKVEIVENKPLARMLYHNVDIGAEIPPELYQAVAEVLAMVYHMKNS